MTLFDWVKQQVSIGDVVGQYARLNRFGNYLKASCLFHSETDASFTVSPEKGIFYCFGCHATGDVIAFVAKIEHLSQHEALTFLIERQGLTVPEHLKNAASKVDTQERKLFFEACAFFKRWAAQQLSYSPIALSYIRQRNVTPESVTMFEIGYMPAGYESINNLLKLALPHGILTQHFVEAGVLAQHAGGMYHSPFEERILFPIHDQLGRCVGFGGRVFRENDTRPKYYNSKESDFFLKRTLLFGFHLAKKALQETECAFLVEGYTDCVALASIGISHVVATLGTACSLDHLKLLSRFVRKVFVLYDGDRAGQQAMLRLAAICWEANIELFVVQLPVGDDPASFVQKGGDILKLAAGAIDIFSFFIKGLAQDFFKKTLSEKMEIGQKIAQVLAGIKDSFKRSLLVAQAAQVMQVPTDALHGLVQRQKTIRFDGEPTVEVSSDEGQASKVSEVVESPTREFEEKIIGALVGSYQDVNLLAIIDNEVLQFFSEDAQRIIRILQDVGQKNETFDSFLEQLTDEEKLWVIPASLRYNHALSHSEFWGLLASFCKQRWREMMTQLKANVHKARQDSDGEQVRTLLSTFSTLRDVMHDKGLV